jgi:uridine kinase
MQRILRSQEEIITYLSTIIDQSKTFLLAIDGRGGSGKTTLAKSIAEHFQAQIINTDDYFDFEIIPAKNYFWNKQDFITDILKPLSQSYTANYQKNKWVNGTFAGEKEIVKIAPKGLIIIEGLMSLQKELLQYYNDSLWLNIDLETSLARAKSRDINEKGWDKNEVELNWSKWIPTQEEYISIEKPDINSNLVYIV